MFQFNECEPHEGNNNLLVIRANINTYCLRSYRGISAIYYLIAYPWNFHELFQRDIISFAIAPFYFAARFEASIGKSLTHGCGRTDES